MTQAFTSERKEKRISQYIKMNLEIGGRILCWHDWVNVISHGGRNEFFYGCVKCGKQKIGNFPSV